jgi:hypothetical protein
MLDEVAGMRKEVGLSSYAVASAANSCEQLVANFAIRSAADLARIDEGERSVLSYIEGYKQAVAKMFDEVEASAKAHFMDARETNRATMEFHRSEMERIAETLRSVRAGRLDGGTEYEVESPALPPFELPHGDSDQPHEPVMIEGEAVQAPPEPSDGPPMVRQRFGRKGSGSASVRTER